MAWESAQAEQAARRRLESLGQELRRTGVQPRVSTDAEPEALPGEVPQAPGRHTRRHGPSQSERLQAWATERTPSTLRGRIRLDRGPALLLVSVAIVAVALAWFTWSRSSGEVEVIPTDANQSPASVLELPDPAASNSPTVAAGTIVVDIAGRVHHPGVLTLPVGSRVIDAITAAGGARPGTRLGTLNQARVLVDGEQIYVGRPPGGLAAAAVTTPGAPTGTSLIPLNQATAQQLETLPGV
ncbi:MAG TPA: SLBB domain-containing protein, partial [Marmoricola sp.]|nr:SLBB domain-containing protein [Marmoricola sp.]